MMQQFTGKGQESEEEDNDEEGEKSPEKSPEMEIEPAEEWIFI